MGCKGEVEYDDERWLEGKLYLNYVGCKVKSPLFPFLLYIPHSSDKTGSSTGGKRGGFYTTKVLSELCGM